MWKLLQTGNILSRYKCFSCSCANPQLYSTQAKICPLLAHAGDCSTTWYDPLGPDSSAGSTNSTSTTSSGSTFPTATWPPWSSVAQTISFSNNSASNTSSTSTWPLCPEIFDKGFVSLPPPLLPLPPSNPQPPLLSPTTTPVRPFRHFLLFVPPQYADWLSKDRKRLELKTKFLVSLEGNFQTSLKSNSRDFADGLKWMTKACWIRSDKKLRKKLLLHRASDKPPQHLFVTKYLLIQNQADCLVSYRVVFIYKNKHDTQSRSVKLFCIA